MKNTIVVGIGNEVATVIGTQQTEGLAFHTAGGGEQNVESIYSTLRVLACMGGVYRNGNRRHDRTISGAQSYPPATERDGPRNLVRIERSGIVNGCDPQTTIPIGPWRRVSQPAGGVFCSSALAPNLQPLARNRHKNSAADTGTDKASSHMPQPGDVGTSTLKVHLR